MSEHTERLLLEMRVRLAQAAYCERRREIDLADAYGAVAANKLAQVIRIDARGVVVPMVRP
jgi:hypothetical protein